MNLQRSKEQIFTKQQIQYIKSYCHLIDIGSEVTCYNLSSKQVIKVFDVKPIDTNTKLFIPDNIYGTNTYIFTDAIQIYCGKVFSYTMKYINGARLGRIDAINLFYNLSYNLLLNYIETLIKDSKTIAKYGIQCFDCFENNIILSNTGFRQIDCVDFTQQDKDPTEIEKENIKLMCQTIWDSLIAPQLSTFMANNKLYQYDFTESPYEFIQELRNKSQNLSDSEIITLDDTKKLSRKK